MWFLLTTVGACLVTSPLFDLVSCRGSGMRTRRRATRGGSPEDARPAGADDGVEVAGAATSMRSTRTRGKKPKPVAVDESGGSSDDEAPEEVSLSAGRQAQAAARNAENAAKKAGRNKGAKQPRVLSKKAETPEEVEEEEAAAGTDHEEEQGDEGADDDNTAEEQEEGDAEAEEEQGREQDQEDMLPDFVLDGLASRWEELYILSLLMTDVCGGALRTAGDQG